MPSSLEECHTTTVVKKFPYDDGRHIPCLNPGLIGSAGYPPFLAEVVVPD